jgi:hypothetical protein
MKVKFDVADPGFKLGQLLALELHRFEEEVRREGGHFDGSCPGGDSTVAHAAAAAGRDGRIACVFPGPSPHVASVAPHSV